MHRITYYIILFMTSVSFFSCEDVIEVDIPGRESRLVVQAWIQDNRDVQTVTLSRSVAYLDAQQVGAETGAEVSVTTASGQTYAFSEERPGQYQGTFQGVPDETYTLRVITQDEQQYASTPQTMPLPVPLDSVYAEFRETPDVENEEDEGYYPFWDFTDPADRENYYRWRVYANDEPVQGTGTILTANDEFVNGEDIREIGFFSMDPLTPADRFTIEQMAITEAAHEFLLRVQELTNNVGGLFDTPPGPVEGNITNTTDETDYALGFFGVAAVRSASAGVEE